MSWYNPTSWFIDEKNVDAGAAADAKLQAMNAKDYGKGGDLYNQVAATEGTAAADANLATVLANQATDATVASVVEAEAQVNQAFVEGLGEAYDERTGQARAVLNAPFKVLWDSVPWYFWLLGAAGLFLYLGGGVWLRRTLLKGVR